MGVPRPKVDLVGRMLRAMSLNKPHRLIRDDLRQGPNLEDGDWSSVGCQTSQGQALDRKPLVNQPAIGRGNAAPQWTSWLQAGVALVPEQDESKATRPESGQALGPEDGERPNVSCQPPCRASETFRERHVGKASTRGPSRILRNSWIKNSGQVVTGRRSNLLL